MKEQIPIYVISLASDTERRESLRQQFPCHYDDFIFVDAIDFRGKRDSEISHLYEKCRWNIRNPLTPTEVACSLSHTKVIEIFLNQNSEWCIILEDDILGGDQDINETKKIIMQNQSANFFLLGGQEGMKNSKYILGHNIDSNLWEICKISLGFCTRACCYAINKPTADLFVKNGEGCADRTDIWKRKLESVDAIFFTQQFKHPEELDQSHLEKERLMQKSSIIKRIYSDGITEIILRIIKKITIIILSRVSNAEILSPRPSRKH